MVTIDPPALIGKRLTVTDPRTGQAYTLTIKGARRAYGKLRVRGESGVWFEPTGKELSK